MPAAAIAAAAVETRAAALWVAVVAGVAARDTLVPAINQHPAHPRSSASPSALPACRSCWCHPGHEPQPCSKATQKANAQMAQKRNARSWVFHSSHKHKHRLILCCANEAPIVDALPHGQLLSPSIAISFLQGCHPHLVLRNACTPASCASRCCLACAARSCMWRLDRGTPLLPLPRRVTVDDDCMVRQLTQASCQMRCA